jgi:hypothetical protein
MENNVRFINIEYVFNRIFDVYLWIKYFVVFKIQGTSQSEYLAAKEGVDYDGLRDRFGLSDPYGSFGAVKRGGGQLVQNSGSQNTDGSGLSFIWNKILSIFGGGSSASVGNSGSDLASSAVQTPALFAYLHDIMTIIALVVIAMYIYSTIMWKEVVAEYNTAYKKSHTPREKPKTKNSKWAVIEAHMASGNEAEWRLAILEADNMLADLLRTLPIAGIDVGEKLTNADRKHFTSLEDAWDAHKIRNRIAHDGSEFLVTEHLARQTIQKFKNVFTEFQYGV